MRIAFWTIPSLLAIASVPDLQICSAQSVSAVGSAPATSTAGCTGLPFSAKETTTYPTHTADGTPIEHKEVHLSMARCRGTRANGTRREINRRYGIRFRKRI